MRPMRRRDFPRAGARPTFGRMDVERWILDAARLVEVAGVVTLLVGGIASIGLVLWKARAPSEWYRLYRRYFGHALLLGLEFLVAADIIRTVTHVPNLENVLVLAIVVLIRTFLSFTIELELEGRWPWQPPRT